MEIDFYSKQQTDSKLDEKANSSDVYKKNETYDIEEINNIIDTKIAEIQIPDVSDFYTKLEVYTKTQVDNLLTPKANTTDVYTKTQVDNLVSPKANSSDVYSKTETYTKSEVNNLVSPKANSSDVYTKTETDNLVSPKANSSDVYTKTQVDNLIASQPVYNGLFRTILTTSQSQSGNYKEIALSGATFGDNDILVISMRIFADSGNIEIPYDTYMMGYINSGYGFGTIRKKVYGASFTEIGEVYINYSPSYNKLTVGVSVSGTSKTVGIIDITTCYVVKGV